MRGPWQPLGKADAQPWTSPDLIWSSLALAGLLLLGTILIVWVRRWRARLAQSRQTPEDQVAHYRDLLGRGEISAEEFERITGVLRGQAPPEPRPPAPPDA
jgi:hypothetical protein